MKTTFIRNSIVAIAAAFAIGTAWAGPGYGRAPDPAPAPRTARWRRPTRVRCTRCAGSRPSPDSNRASTCAGAGMTKRARAAATPPTARG